MAKKKVTKQSVRQSNKQRRKEKERQETQRRRIIAGAILGVIVIIVAFFLWQSFGHRVWAVYFWRSCFPGRFGAFVLWRVGIAVISTTIILG